MACTQCCGHVGGESCSGLPSVTCSTWSTPAGGRWVSAQKRDVIEWMKLLTVMVLECCVYFFSFSFHMSDSSCITFYSFHTPDLDQWHLAKSRKDLTHHEGDKNCRMHHQTTQQINLCSPFELWSSNELGGRKRSTNNGRPSTQLDNNLTTKTGTTRSGNLSVHRELSEGCQKGCSWVFITAL